MSTNQILIGNRPIGPGQPPFIVAEMSGNHNQSLERALELVESAAHAGVHALKIQTYTADTMTLDKADGEFFISEPKSLWKGKSLYNLYQEAHTPWDWHASIFKKAKELGLIAFSTPFDESAVEFLEELEVPCYKIASFEVADLPLIQKAAKTGKPLIISTGMASIAELDEAVSTARKAGYHDVILLKCTSSYPAEPIQTNLKTIAHMQKLFQTQVGLSDHTQGMGVALASVALGATVIEKHFTLRRADGGVDSEFSLEPEEIAQLVTESKRVWQALGSIHYGTSGAEKSSMQFRRSLYVAEDIKTGERFTNINIRSIRPNLGLPPKYRDIFLGRRARKNLNKGMPLSWDMLG